MKIFKNESAKERVMQSYNEIMNMWDVDVQEYRVETDYGSTYCLTAGNSLNPPLLLFHGVGDNSAVMWMLNMKELSKHFYCIAVDTIGGPGKSIPNAAYTKQSFDQIQWIDQIVDFFKLKVIHIAGVSNGGYMAYNYTTVRREKVRRAICLEGGMVTNPIKTMFETLLMMFPEILMPTQNNMFKILKKMSSPSTDIFDRYPILAEHLVLLMKSHNQQAMFPHKIVKYDKQKGVANKDKLLFLVAEHGLSKKRDFMEILKDGKFHYKVITNAGHGINHEQPDIVHKEIIEFIQK